MSRYPVKDGPDAQIGFFGKIPGHGDFVRRAFPAELNKPWDSWLQAGLAKSREALGTDWLDAYLSSPIWRFCLSSGLCGASQWTGAMMPSIDRVGRYFPLTVVTEIPAHSSLFAVAALAAPWFRALEKTMLATLEEESLTAEGLETLLTALPPLVDCTSVDALAQPQLADGDGCAAVRLEQCGRVDDAPGLLADALARRICGDFSLWWSGGSANVPAGARIYLGLPPAEVFSTLLRE